MRTLIRTPLKLTRLLGAAYSMSLRRELAFRVNLGVDVLLALVTLGSALAVVQLVFTRTDDLAGWSRTEVIVLVGTFQFMSGLKATFLDPNLAFFAVRGIREGRLDVYLLQPAPSLFLASFGIASPLNLIQSGLGLGVVGLGISQSGTGVSPLGVAGWLLFVAIGVAVAWMLGVLVGCLAFWAPRLELEVMYSSFWQLARYPVQVYRGPLRFILTYVFPMVLISTTPSHVLMNGIEPRTFVASVGAAGFAVAIGTGVWRLGLRRYTGATS